MLSNSVDKTEKDNVFSFSFFLLHGSGSKSLAQLVMPDSQTADERNAHKRRADSKRAPQGQHVRMQDLGFEHGAESGRLVRVGKHDPDRWVLQNQGAQVRFDCVVENGARDGHSKDGANGTEESSVGGGDGNVLGRDCGLDREHQGLHRETETATVDEQVANDLTLGRVLVQENQETSAGGGKSKTDPDKGTELSVLGNHDTGTNRSDQQTDNQGQHLETRGGGRFLPHNLEEQGHEEHDTKEAHADKERCQEDGVVGAGPEQIEGDDGLDGLLPFDEQEHTNDGKAADHEANDNGRVPRVGRTTPVQGQQDHDQANDEGD